MSPARIVRWAALGVALAALPPPVAAQSPAEQVQAVRDAVGQLDDGAAEAAAVAALARPESFTPDQLVELHATLGRLLHARNETVGARQNFEAALSLDPALRLDSVLVSPKTLTFFEEVRASVERPAAGAPAPAVRYVVVPDRRSGAGLRSAVLPGWGQLYKGDRGRGWAFAIGAGTTAAGAVAAHLARAQARRDYLAATDPGEIADRYRVVRRWTTARGVFVVGAGVVWAAAVVDALTTGAPRAPQAVELEPGVSGLSLRIQL